MVKIQSNYRNAGKNIEQEQVKGSGTKIDGIYYYIVPQQEKQHYCDVKKSARNKINF
jgi:anionic cell wall polymer biosynthesis LytR-Cps2A-Psr (LCP) family protein